MTSTNAFSFLLKRINPPKRKTKVQTALYRIISGAITPVPKQEYLKHSITAVMGLRQMKVLRFPDTSERGYTTGVAYMNLERKKASAIARSRYLVVIEEMELRLQTVGVKVYVW